MTLQLFRPAPSPPTDGPIYVANGVGTNSVAVLIFLVNHGLASRVKAIVTTDPGSEWKRSRAYLADVLRPWCQRVGLPDPVVTTRGVEAQFRGARAWRAKAGETLYEECARTGRLPSAAYGFKKCSQKFKGEVARWWTARQPWARELWKFRTVRVPIVEDGRALLNANGKPRFKIRRVPADGHQKILKVIGYDVDEGERVKRGLSFANPWEHARFHPWYPLHEAGIDREECEAIILRAGLPLPGKSACTYCPNNTREEWIQLRREEPDAFAAAVALSRAAAPNDAIRTASVSCTSGRTVGTAISGGRSRTTSRASARSERCCVTAMRLVIVRTEDVRP